METSALDGRQPLFLDINGHPLCEPLDEDKAEELVLSVAQSQLVNVDIAERLQHFVAV